MIDQLNSDELDAYAYQVAKREPTNQELRDNFVKKYAEFVIKLTRGTGIYPETLFTQCIVENANKDGVILKGILAEKFNNLFGIKATPNWSGSTVILDTPNDADKKSKFRVYNSYQDSMKDYVLFLKKNPRYKKAGVFEAKNYSQQLARIAGAGYAESKNYLIVLNSVSKKVHALLDKMTPSKYKAVLTIFAIAAGILILTESYETN